MRIEYVTFTIAASKELNYYIRSNHIISLTNQSAFGAQTNNKQERKLTRPKLKLLRKYHVVSFFLIRITNKKGINNRSKEHL